MRSAIGVPVVRPSNAPERLSTVSAWRRCVTCRDVPGLRRSSSGWMSAASSKSPGGQPSITHPIAGPCDSPKEVTQNSLPNVLPDMGRIRERPGGAGVASARLAAVYHLTHAVPVLPHDTQRLRRDATHAAEQRAAEAMARRCDLMLVVGTSAEVYPAAALPSIAKASGAIVIEINPNATAL